MIDIFDAGDVGDLDDAVLDADDELDLEGVIGLNKYEKVAESRRFYQIQDSFFAGERTVSANVVRLYSFRMALVQGP